MFKIDNFISCGYDKEHCQKIIVQNYQAILYEYISKAEIYHPARFGMSVRRCAQPRRCVVVGHYEVIQNENK